MIKVIYVVFVSIYCVSCATQNKVNQTSTEKSWRDDTQKNVPKKEIYQHTPNNQGAIPADVPQTTQQFNREGRYEIE